MKLRHLGSVLLFPLVLAACVGTAGEVDREREDWAQEVTASVLPGVVQVRTSAGNAGSGFVVNSSGWVVTNAHVAAGSPDGVVVFADPPRMLGYSLVAEGHSRDLALLRVHSEQLLPALPLGWSGAHPLGSRLLVIGAPQQMFPVVTTGILSGRMRPGFPGVSIPPEQLMISAPTLRGNSGSPVLDTTGRVIGVMSAKPQQEAVLLQEPGDDEGRAFDKGYRRWAQQPEAFGLVVPVDDLRTCMAAWLAPQQNTGLETGFELDPLSEPPRVVHVTPGSEAAVAGLRVGDVIRGVSGSPVDTALDVALSLYEEPAGEVRLRIGRGSGEEQVDFKRRAWRAPTREELAPGLTWSLRDGAHDKLPARGWHKPGAEGAIEVVDLPEVCHGREGFALQLDGFVEVPATGAWRFGLVSDDGSQLFIHDRLVVDNDGLHGDRQAEGVVELEAGLHPLRIRFFEKGGAETLRALMGPEGGEGSLAPIPAGRLWSLSSRVPGGEARD